MLDVSNQPRMRVIVIAFTLLFLLHNIIAENDCSINNGGCEHICVNTSEGSRCTCQLGYRLGSNRTSCIDFDECNSGVEFCVQTCQNTEGSFYCDCVSGYTLQQDNRTCKALAESGDAYLIYADRATIGRVTTEESEITPIVSELRNAIAVDFHYDQNLIFWSDVTDEKIKKAYVNGSNIREVITDGLMTPVDLAVDWIHDKLFWTDEGTQRIEVADLDGLYRKVIVSEGLGRPRGIVAYPPRGIIFWTDCGHSPKIERAGMDGSRRTAIVTEAVHYVNGLTIDYTTNHLYWTEAKFDGILRTDFDGNNRRWVVSRGVSHPFAVTYFEDKLYWTDWRTQSINKAVKFRGGTQEVVRTGRFQPMGLIIWHPLRQPGGSNRCASSNCDYLCLPNEISYSCACPTGLQLRSDRRTCGPE